MTRAEMEVAVGEHRIRPIDDRSASRLPDAHELLGIGPGAPFSEALQGFSRGFVRLADELLGAEGDGRSEAIDRWLALCAALEEQAKEESG